jgi:hypothetical protein
MDCLSRSVLWLTVLFLLPIALIRAQPYNNRELRSILVPSHDCTVLCFMGIQPGVTTAQEAIRILENHEWVADIEGAQSQEFWETLTAPGFTTPLVHWTWNDRPPTWLDRERGGELWLVSGQVRYVGVYTSFLLGDMLLTLGNPDSSNIVSYVNANGRFWSYDGWYGRQRLWLATGGLCPIRQLYTRQLLIRFQAAPPDFYGLGAPRSTC